jgi:hypothetical protein
MREDEGREPDEQDAVIDGDTPNQHFFVRVHA